MRYRQSPAAGMPIARANAFPYNGLVSGYRKYNCWCFFVLSNELPAGTVTGMNPKTITTEQGLELFIKSLLGDNLSAQTIRAYTDDLHQFIDWLKEVRMDWDTPRHFTRIDIVEFLNHLAAQKSSGVTRARKLAAIRKFFKFLKDNDTILGNPAETVKGPVKEEKDPPVLYRNEYKALLYEASQSPRDYAILQVFLQTGVRVSELVNLMLEDVDLENRLLIVRQGKGKRDRTIPLEEQATTALLQYLLIRKAIAAVDDNLFLARNGTSLSVRTIRYMVKKYMDKAGIHKKRSVHTLRHTCGTHKVDKGMTIPTLKELFGHKKMETTYKYVHLAQSNLRQQQEQTAL